MMQICAEECTRMNVNIENIKVFLAKIASFFNCIR